MCIPRMFLREATYPPTRFPDRYAPQRSNGLPDAVSQYDLWKMVPLSEIETNLSQES